MELINTKFVIYAKHIQANQPGPVVLPFGGAPFEHTAKPFIRTAFYGGPDSSVAMAWSYKRIRKDRKTFRINGVLYQLSWIKG